MRQVTKPGITLITIGVDDLEASPRFYRDGLGFPTKGIVGQEHENGAVAFIDLKHGLRLAHWARKSIAADAGVPQSPNSPTEFTLALNVAGELQVDAVMKQSAVAGAHIVKPAHKTFWGG